MNLRTRELLQIDSHVFLLLKVTHQIDISWWFIGILFAAWLIAYFIGAKLDAEKINA